MSRAKRQITLTFLGLIGKGYEKLGTTMGDMHGCKQKILNTIHFHAASRQYYKYTNRLNKTLGGGALKLYVHNSMILTDSLSDSVH